MLQSNICRQHMDDACDELCGIIDDDVKDGLMKYFRHMGSTFVVGTERMESFATLRLDEDLPVNGCSHSITTDSNRNRKNDNIDW